VSNLTANLPAGALEALTLYEVEPQPTERRRLQTKLTDGSGRERKDAFVAGQRHELRVRIAAEVT
jgi:hypothetical protein